jgi:hypothetical protein
MADYLEWPESVLLAHIDPHAQAAPPSGGELNGLPSLRLVKVIGAVQAEEWREVVEWPSTEQSYVYASVDAHFVGVNIFALQVRGLAMNRLFPEGTVLICVGINELPSNFTFQTGDKVIVRRRAQSGLLEATVKEYVVESNGSVFLWPRSTDPHFQQPWPLPVASSLEEEKDELQIIGLVIGSTRSEVSSERFRSSAG